MNMQIPRYKQSNTPPRPSLKVPVPISIDETLHERGLRYGQFAGHAEISQAFKKLMRRFLEDRGKELAADQEEALDMTFHKIARVINGDADYSDSWVDIAGYNKLVADRLEGETK